MLVGVTGNIGSGKSTFARLLAGLGACVVDADQLARQVVDESPAVRRDLAAAFGADLIDEGGAIDRRRLAQRALAGEVGRRRLEAIVRPRLEPRLWEALATAQAAAPVAVLDAPLLFEWGIAGRFDLVVRLVADPEAAAARVAAARGLSLDEVRGRRAAQLDEPGAEGIRLVVVDNNGTLEDLRAAALRVWDLIRGPATVHSTPPCPGEPVTRRGPAP